jgi:cellulose 1,4-beta-cellobiosidase
MYPQGHLFHKQAHAGRFDSRIALLFALFIFVLIAPGAFAQTVTHVTNPYAGAVNYLNPDYTAEVQTAIAAQPAGSTLAQQMQTAATYPTAVWLDHIGAINGSVPTASSSISRLGLQGHINAAKLQQADTTKNPSGLPIVVELMIYDLPDRDCAALASNGELSIAGGDTIIDSNGNPQTLTGNGLSEYENFYITPIANILKTEANNPKIRFVLVVEDDSLPNLITNVGQSGAAIQACVNANGGMSSQPSTTGVYVQAIQFALSTFHQIPNVYNYLDVGHHGWLGWQQNEQAAVPFFASVAKGAGGFATVDGFITNTANYGPTTEPFMTANEMIGGQPVRGGSFYHFNQFIDEESYAADMDKQLIAAGFPATLGFLIDTSRNGWGSNLRPTAASTSTTLDTFIGQSKIDLRTDMGQWCNQPHAGMGAPPQVNPGGFANLSAFVWMKPPGESDGNYPGSVFNGITSTVGDPNCDPNHNNALANNMPSGAVPNSPHAGTFWLPYYTMLVQNAFPVIPPSGGTIGNGSFTLTPSSASLSLKAGATAADVITVTGSGGFTGAVTFTVGGLPTGVTPSFSTNPATSSTTLTLTAATTVASAGPITVTITGVSGSTTASTTVALTVIGTGGGGGFTLTPASTNLTVTAGGSTPDTITIADTGGFTGAVTFTVSGLPAGVTPTFSSNPATGTTTTLTLTAATSAASAGPVTVTITGTSGTTSATTTVSVTVKGGGGGGACHVAYTITPQNTSAFGATLAITNNGTSTLSNWTLTWTFANGQTIANSWNGTATQVGANVSVSQQTGQTWQNIPPGGSYTGFGFNGTWNGTTNSIPTAFSLNGVACN